MSPRASSARRDSSVVDVEDGVDVSLVVGVEDGLDASPVVGVEDKVDTSATVYVASGVKVEDRVDVAAVVDVAAGVNAMSTATFSPQVGEPPSVEAAELCNKVVEMKLSIE